MATTTRSLAGRTALVTGGGSGLGRAMCLRLARGGAQVLVADIDLDGAEETVRRVEAAGGRAAARLVDVTDTRSVDDAVAWADGFDGFDLLVNNAGTDTGAGIMEITDAQWARVFGVNVDGPMRTMRAFLRLVRDGGARKDLADVVNVISISAITVGTEAGAYNSSKAALAKLTEVVQREANEYDYPVRIQGIMPAAMNTPMMTQWSLQDEQMMDPDVVAAHIEHLVCQPRDVFVQNTVLTLRKEPGFPR